MTELRCSCVVDFCPCITGATRWRFHFFEFPDGVCVGCCAVEMPVAKTRKTRAAKPTGLTLHFLRQQVNKKIAFLDKILLFRTSSVFCRVCYVRTAQEQHTGVCYVHRWLVLCT